MRRLAVSALCFGFAACMFASQVWPGYTLALWIVGGAQIALAMGVVVVQMIERGSGDTMA